MGKLPAQGHLAKISKFKYGPRESKKESLLQEMFKTLSEKVPIELSPEKIITDGAPLYKSLVRRYFPTSQHQVVISRVQKEAKRDRLYLKENEITFDPMFALNQRCAKLRADIRRLRRRSWCTTKNIMNLQKHLQLYQLTNNLALQEA